MQGLHYYFGAAIESSSELFQGKLLSPKAVQPEGFFICKTCKQALCSERLPANAIANGNAINEDMFAAEDLSDVETCLINPVALRVMIVELMPTGDPAARQHGLGSHATFFAANPELALTQFLPRAVEQLPNFVNVFFSAREGTSQSTRARSHPAAR